MSEFLITYQPQITALITFIYVPLTVFVITIGMVYIFGRMLEILKNYRTKNFFALFTMIALYMFYFFRYNHTLPINEMIWTFFVYISISALLYVLIGFKLYNRVDTLLDRVVPDTIEKIEKKEKKK